MCLQKVKDKKNQCSTEINVKKVRKKIRKIKEKEKKKFKNKEREKR